MVSGSQKHAVVGKSQFWSLCTLDSYRSDFNSLVCTATVSQPPPKQVLQRIRSVSPFKFQFLHFSLRSTKSCLPLLPRLSVTHILPSIFPSVACFRRQFLRKMWPIHLTFLRFTVCIMFLSLLTLCNTSSFSTRSVQPIFPILFYYYISKHGCGCLVCNE
jgi:hypothetical protein